MQRQAGPSSIPLERRVSAVFQLPLPNTWLNYVLGQTRIPQMIIERAVPLELSIAYADGGLQVQVTQHAAMLAIAIR